MQVQKVPSGAEKEDKFKCKHCVSSFPEQKYLNRHLKSKHPKEWDEE